MNRAAAINHATAGANKLWAGTVTIHADAKTGAHHHGALESIIYIVSGRPYAMGEKLEFVCEAGPGISFTYRPMCLTKRSMPTLKSLWNVFW